MSSGIEDEVDTVLNDDKQLTEDLNSIVVDRNLQAQNNSDAPTIIQKSFRFDDVANVGYGELVRISLRLMQTGDGEGYAYLTFTQQMRCRKSDRVTGPDMTFNVSVTDAHGSFVRNIYCGAWDRKCGDHLVELREKFTWVHGSINPVENAASIVLNFRHFQRVHNCR